MKFALNYKKIMIVALLTLLAVISITKIAPAAADPANHKHSIEQTEEKIASVMTLSGGAAATSATLSLLPGDMCTPLAEQLAELAKYLSGKIPHQFVRLYFVYDFNTSGLPFCLHRCSGR